MLLPPSEGKTAPLAGATTDPADMWLPQLAAARRRVLGRLVGMCARRSPRGITASLHSLGLSSNQIDEVTRNAGLGEAPAGPAADVYTGVLYRALAPETLDASARDWVDQQVAVFSGLWGVLRLHDRIPAYRCAVGVTLPGVGGLGAYWKATLARHLPAAVGDGPVLDLRSGAYAGMWAPAGPLAARTAVVRVLHERTVDGATRRSIVSHVNKATKGRLVRALACADARPSTVDELIGTLRDLAYTVEERPAPAGRPRQLDLVVREL